MQTTITARLIRKSDAKNCVGVAIATLTILVILGLSPLKLGELAASFLAITSTITGAITLQLHFTRAIASGQVQPA